MKDYSFIPKVEKLPKGSVTGKNNEEMWKHIFKAKPACNVVFGENSIC